MIKSPKEVYGLLSEEVIGQDYAKRVLSVAVYNHCLRCTNPESNIEKSNILLLGPTGTGKTLLAKTLAKSVRLPIAIADATSLTQAGYVGEDVENCLLRLIQAAGGDVKLAERGILFIDEIDKLGRKSESPSITRDVSGEGVQQALLKLIEGSGVNVPSGGGRKRPDSEGYIPIDTSNILFICSGAFEGLSINKEVKTGDLTQFGMLPELIGRLPVVAQLNPLDSADVLRILMEPKKSIVSQYQEIFKLSGGELTFDVEALEVIADVAVNRRIGARGLRSILEGVLLDKMFELPNEETVRVTQGTVFEYINRGVN